MSYSYLLLPEAQDEYEEAVQWYLDRSFKAAEEFITAVDNALILICDHPDRWRNEYGNYHELGLKKYPYAIVYSIDKGKRLVVVSAIYHYKRDPDNKYRSLR